MSYDVSEPTQLLKIMAPAYESSLVWPHCPAFASLQTHYIYRVDGGLGVETELGDH